MPRSLNFTQKSVRELIRQFDHAELLIPEFQRPYVWKPRQAALLVDSMYRGYPIGSLLVWNASAAVEARNERPRRRAAAGHWLIDGQQRVTTLSWIKSGDQLDVVFNPDTEGFRVANKQTRRDPRWTRVSEVWGESTYRELVRTRKWTGEQHRALDQLREVLSVPVPVTEMNQHAFEDAVDAFSRLNKQGRRLAGADLASAKLASKHGGFIRDEVVPLVSSLQDGGFTGLKVTHLFRACAAIARPDGRTRTQLHELETREVKAAWRKLKKGVSATRSLVASEFALSDMRLLRSGALLVPPLVHLALASPRDRRGGELAGWISLAALFHRYSKAGQTALDQDLRACHATDPVGALLRNIRDQTDRLQAKASDFKGTLADQGALFAAYVACREEGAVDLFTGQKIVHHKTLDHHHILPRATFPDATRRQADVVANIAFVLNGTNRSIGAIPAAEYLPQIRARRRASQCIPVRTSLYVAARRDKFFLERRKELAVAFNKATRRHLPGRKLR